MSNSKPKILFPLFVAILSAFYLTEFYVLNNITMFNLNMILIFTSILIVPVIIAVVMLWVIAALVKRPDLINYFSILISVFYVLLLLYPATVKISTIENMVYLFGEPPHLIIYGLYVTVIAIFVAWLFRKDIKKYALLLTILIATVFATNIFGVFESYGAWQEGSWDRWENYRNVALKNKPNIFLIVPDSYASFAFLKNINVDVRPFRDYLTNSGFSLYDEYYSAYQPTLNSMPAILNMEHHYHTITARNFTEASVRGRRITAGDNNFFKTLKNNGYVTQNIHRSRYLLLQGSGADYSYPEASAPLEILEMLNQVFEWNFEDQVAAFIDLDQGLRSLDDFFEKVISEIDGTGGKPIVRYVHLDGPGHSPNSVAGHCNESKEIGGYSHRVNNTNGFLRQLIDGILDRDHDALIVLVGDHGPYLLNKCSRQAFLETKRDLRDRASSLLAIRWPDGYDGRYDGQIKTSVNLLKYLLAFLSEREEDLLDSRVADEVYVRMRKGLSNPRFYKVMVDGDLLARPEVLPIR